MENLKHGLKHSEASEVPEDWNVKKLSELGEFFSGGTPNTSLKEYYNGEIPFIKSGEIYGNITAQFLTNKGLNNSSAKIVQKGDILYALYGANSGEVSISKIEGAINQAILCIRPNIESLFLINYLTLIKDKVVNRFIQGGQGNLSAKLVKGLRIPIPPLKEQEKIAQILTQWDEAIETTQTLIDQLQLRKKGLMQELLSGKKRLAGFSEEWEIIRGDKLFASISNKKHDGEFEVLSATQDKGVIPRSETGIDIKYDKKSLGNYKKLDIGDFVISLRSFQGGIEYSNYEGLVSPAYTVLREKLPIAKRFYQEYMKTENFINRLNSIIYGIRDGKQISYKEFGSLKFEYPPLIEQKAISKIIGLAGTEIEVKKAYLLKLKEQKKGLMQQLLTGKKRVKLN